MQLHPVFACSLRMAQGQGLDALIAAAEELPLQLPSPLAHAERVAAATAADAAATAVAAGTSAEPAAATRGSGGDGGGVLAGSSLAAAGAGPLPCNLACRDSAAPASSLDTASSLRQSRQEAVAAAVGEVVEQIAVNGRSRPRHRLSRKQRQKRRRQLQREQEQREQRASEAAAALLGSMQKARLPPPPPAQQQQQQHWAQARKALDAALPQRSPKKRMRLQISDS